MYKFSKLGGCDSIIKAATAEDLRPTAMATVAEVWGHSYGRRFYL